MNFKQDLKRSGITKPFHLKKLKIKALTATQTKNKCDIEKASYLIPYFQKDGKVIKDFFRIRLLEEHYNRKKKLVRYTQPADIPPRIYYCPLVNWIEVLADISIPLYITEGEKKAIKACIEGLNCIGLGGVWNWKSKKKNIPIIKDFLEMELKGRQINIIYDNDVTTNPSVRNALYALSLKLAEQGAEVFIIYLPDEKDKKIGLDDFLLKHSPEELLDLEYEEFVFLKPIHELNQKICYVNEVDSIVKLENFKQVTAERAVNTYPGTIDAVNNNGNIVQKDLIAVWLKSPLRLNREKLVYSPGNSLLQDNGDLNIWTPFPVSPIKGSNKPFMELFNYLTEGLHSDHRNWFLCWLAYPLQNMGIKISSAVVLRSDMTGTGKTLLGITMSRIYGKNYAKISQEQLYSQYNDWCSGKQFIHSDEITGTDKRRDIDKLKELITQEVVTVNAKYQVPYTIRDMANFYLTSNQVTPVYIDDKDRRFFFHDVPEYRLDQKFYRSYGELLNNKKFISAVYYYLKNEVNCEKFNPYAEPPVTESKKDMIEFNYSEAEAWMHLLHEDPDQVLRTDGIKWNKCELFSNSQLFERFKLEHEQSRITKQGFGHALKRMGFKRCKLIRFRGKSERFWAIRNSLHWLKASNDEIKEHFNITETNVFKITQQS